MSPTTSNIRTIDEARCAVKKLNAIGEMTYGIFANPTGTHDYLSEEDMALNGITEGNLLIRMKVPVANPTSEDVPAHGEYQSVDSVLDLIARASSPDEAASQLVKMLNPGISDSATTSRLMAMPGVQSAYSAAVAMAWEAA